MFKKTALLLVLLSSAALAQRSLTPAPRYSLHKGDQIAVHYPLSPEFDQQVTIQPDGFIGLTLGGEVKVAGLTLPEATKLINTNATARLKDPNVQLTLTDFQHPYFIVAGEVNNPNHYDLRDEMSALQALMLAGGSRISGKDTQILLIHGAGTPQPTVRILDMKKITAQTVSENPMLASGDIVFVPRNKITNAQQVANIITPFAGYASPAASIAIR